MALLLQQQLPSFSVVTDGTSNTIEVDYSVFLANVNTAHSATGQIGELFGVSPVSWFDPGQGKVINVNVSATFAGNKVTFTIAQVPPAGLSLAINGVSVGLV